MSYLFDTHALLWAMSAPERLSSGVKDLILDRGNDLVVSTVNLWEIAIKVQRNRLDVPASADFFERELRTLGIDLLLSVVPAHVYATLTLPKIHSDPFDRMLAAQSRHEGLTLITADRTLRKYPIEVIW